MHVSVAGKTDVGRARGHNEDFLLQDADLGLFVVCDGMGGHASGEVASRTAAEAIHAYVEQRRALLDGFDGSEQATAAVRNMLREAIEHASRTVFDLAAAEHGRHGMGTTCISMLVVRGKGIMGHVGDSRLYCHRDGVVYQLSEDHTYLNDAVKSGMMTPEQAAASPYAHMITRGVGIQATVTVDTFVFDVLPGDTYLLCSDGLHGYVEAQHELAHFLSDSRTENIVESLVAVANERGGKDNITALVVRASANAQPDELARRSEILGDLHTLRILPLFLDFDMKELVGTLNHFHAEAVPAGQYALREGDKSESLFVCVSGELEVERGGKVISRIRPGNSFGEMALLNRRPRSASVRAVTDARLLVLERDDFYRLMNQDALLGAKFLFKLAQDLSLRLDEFYQVADAEDRERRTMKLEVLSPFRRAN